MQNKARYLHILLSEEAIAATTALNWSLLTRKHPGEHIVVTRKELVVRTKAYEQFTVVHELDMSFMQKIAFTPLLGDQTAFQFFWNSLSEISRSKWDRVFNFGTDALSISLTSLFSSSNILGATKTQGSATCSNSPLKLSAILARWKLGHPIVSQMLVAKAMQQLELAPWEESLSRTLEIKSQKRISGIKNTLIGLRLYGAQTVSENVLAFLGQVFTVVAADTFTSDILTSLQITHLHGEGLPQEIMLDVLLTDGPQPQTMWIPSHNITDITVEELTEKLSDILPLSFAKWAALSFLFDYLGSSKCSLLAEKILARYERQALQPFLHHEVLQLRDFAKGMLDNIRRPDAEAIRLLEVQLAERAGLLGFVAAIELSLSERLDNLIAEQDLAQLKRRLRSLNEFYERLHRACTIEIPKTDLALTL
jgi:hypothetical protein